MGGPSTASTGRWAVFQQAAEQAEDVRRKVATGELPSLDTPPPASDKTILVQNEVLSYLRAHQEVLKTIITRWGFLDLHIRFLSESNGCKAAKPQESSYEVEIFFRYLDSQKQFERFALWSEENLGYTHKDYNSHGGYDGVYVRCCDLIQSEIYVVPDGDQSAVEEVVVTTKKMRPHDVEPRTSRPANTDRERYRKYTPLRPALDFLQPAVDLYERLDMDLVRRVYESCIGPDSQQAKDARAKLADPASSGRVHMTLRLGPVGGDLPDISEKLLEEKGYQRASWAGTSSSDLNMREAMHLYRMLKADYDHPWMFYTTAWIWSDQYSGDWHNHKRWFKRDDRVMCPQPQWRRHSYGLAISVLIRSNPEDPWPLKANEPASMLVS